LSMFQIKKIQHTQSFFDYFRYYLMGTGFCRDVIQEDNEKYFSENKNNIEPELKKKAMTLGRVIRFNIYVFHIFCFLYQHRVVKDNKKFDDCKIFEPRCCTDGEYDIASRLCIKTIRDSPMWNFNMIHHFSNSQSSEMSFVEKLFTECSYSEKMMNQLLKQAMEDRQLKQSQRENFSSFNGKGRRLDS
jgi:hypothetical protein